MPLELLHEQGIVVWQDICGWEKVQRVISLLLAEFLISFDILDHEVLAGELHVVGEVVDQLVRLQPDSIIRLEYLVYSLHRGPVYMPPLPVSMVLLPLAPGEIANNTVVVKVASPTDYHTLATRKLEACILGKLLAYVYASNPAVCVNVHELWVLWELHTRHRLCTEGRT